MPAQAAQRPPPAWLAAIGRLDAHHRQWLALPAAALAALAPAAHSPWHERFLLGWDVYAAVLLGLMWITLLTHDPDRAHRLTRLEDSSRGAIFGSVLIAAGVSLLAIFFSLLGQKAAPPAGRTVDLLRTVLTVFLSWALIHTLFTLHYAHVFHRLKSASPATHGGLSIPGHHAPGYLDFAYFAFTIGMTFQTSDIGITHTAMRRLTLIHGIISFIYSTMIVALLVNVVAALGKG